MSPSLTGTITEGKVQIGKAITYVAAHQGLFDSSLPIFAAASSIIEREFSVMLIVQRKYVVDYE